MYKRPTELKTVTVEANYGLYGIVSQEVYELHFDIPIMNQKLPRHKKPFGRMSTRKNWMAKSAKNKPSKYKL